MSSVFLQHLFDLLQITILFPTVKRYRGTIYRLTGAWLSGSQSYFLQIYDIDLLQINILHVHGKEVPLQVKRSGYH